MKIGYARVSTDDQDLTFQLQVLKEAGCKRIYQEKISGAHKKRPELEKMLEHLREDDTIIVWRLDRLALQELTKCSKGFTTSNARTVIS
ncbi:hypothetical protein ID47_07570 [Candidatus Paracaedibacter acanthamoebae]|uniref:Resolvase/invertase-type recombinase catalytic domain-containing protein n=1 Tax=Candidatus Odyssella acanthamoebae TaxID=91604 RepID=A0A077AY87_9PROT|nr:recombinase family protein [Candidatus Paracaedibacter acanthamoebae]AIK96608.1 hypothetical protein ID47_07570 [Candidatus Paracaedibacter acanthamoebae]